MDASEQLKEDLRTGQIDGDRLVDLVASSQQQLHAAKQVIDEQQKRIDEQQKRIDEQQERIDELERQLGGVTPAKVDEPYSMRAEEKRQHERGKKKGKTKDKGKKRRGRVTTAEKIKQAERTEPVFPKGVDKSDCKLSHVRPVWRLEEGRAVLVAYEIYRGPNNRYGVIPGVLGRSEFALEIIIEIAYLVYVIGMSFDKACLILQFMQNLPLKKSQADALLRQLARHWEEQFDVLCTLLANSLVVHTDETSWSLNSVWAFLSEKARILLYGVHKDAETLKAILDPATFAGLVFSDDAANYANFTHAQKCWAHLLRKAIKLTLQDPNNKTYRGFTDRLLEIYREACRVQTDGRFSEEGRKRKVVDLDDAIVDLCYPVWSLDLPPLEGLENDFRLLANELMRLMLAEQLFRFVLAKPVEQPNGELKPIDGTNNESERTLRRPAQARDTGRTNKTSNGARRQSIVTSVLESLRLYLPTFNLTNVIVEVQRWLQMGRSCFTELLEKLQLRAPEQSVLDQVLPKPSG